MPQQTQHQQVRPHRHPRSVTAQQTSLERHRRKCAVCHHPEREAIEEEFLHWHNPVNIVHEFDLGDRRILYRHAHATGLYDQRRRNYLFTIENVLECGDDIEFTAAAYIKAVRAYACLCDTVRWTEPEKRILMTTVVRKDEPSSTTTSTDPDETSTPSEQDVASFASSLPQAAVDSPARSAVRSARAASHRPRDSSVRQAKNYLRVSRSPEFLNPNRSLDRHRRKCAICCHPEREMIEELFVRWHSPQAIANHLEDWDNVNWVSIYRHAYALGLDQVRRRNLRHFFENLLDDAINATPTFAGVLGAARALGCVTEDGRWVEPEKRILMTTVIRKEEPSSTTSTDPNPPADPADTTHLVGATLGSPAPAQQASHRVTRKAAPTDTAPPPQTEVAHPHAAPVGADYDRPAFPRRASAAASPQFGHKLDEVSSASLLPQAAFGQPADASQTPPSGQPSAARRNGSVAASATALPQAAFDQSADASQTPPSGQPSAARRNESVAASAAALPEAAPHQPAAAKRTPADVPDPASLPPCFLASSSSREIRLPLNSHKTKEKPISNR